MEASVWRCSKTWVSLCVVAWTATTSVSPIHSAVSPFLKFKPISNILLVGRCTHTQTHRHRAEEGCLKWRSCYWVWWLNVYLIVFSIVAEWGSVLKCVWWLCFSTFSRTLDQIAPISTKSWNLRRVRTRGSGNTSISGMFRVSPKIFWARFFTCCSLQGFLLTLYQIFQFSETVLKIQTTATTKKRKIQKIQSNLTVTDSPCLEWHKIHSYVLMTRQPLNHKYLVMGVCQKDSRNSIHKQNKVYTKV